jgi:Tfp pilus assembly protein FimT
MTGDTDASRSRLAKSGELLLVILVVASCLTYALVVAKGGDWSDSGQLFVAAIALLGLIAISRTALRRHRHPR